ncbi:Na(+)/H(+) exchange regulatory cofactor NHE-RF1-like isoform X1 [Planococcus citri]|uniref:Na(+)/H(+) exchange regulatory cofactor NHE-RF1-like isoform X1 n=1 Tax=Planococcus citri TaxID=170843 RepID=UPI0031FA10D7
MSNDTLDSKYKIRLCHILKCDNFDGYGFNLHSEKGKPGQYIGKVDEGSPAESAGLKEGDRIIEVNGVNISNENHKQVVQRIKSVPDETKLLVVDSEADNYFKSKNIIIKSNHESVIYLRTTSSKVSYLNGKNNNDSQSPPISGKNGSYFDIENNGEKTSSKGSSTATTPSSDRKTSQGSSPEPHLDFNEIDNKHAMDNHRIIDNNKLNLNMTAKELRAQLASRKKYDPKKDCLDFKKKYDIVQKL